MRLYHYRGVQRLGVELLGAHQIIMTDEAVKVHPKRDQAHLVDDIDAHDDSALDMRRDLVIPHNGAENAS